MEGVIVAMEGSVAADDVPDVATVLAVAVAPFTEVKAEGAIAMGAGPEEPECKSPLTRPFSWGSAGRLLSTGSLMLLPLTLRFNIAFEVRCRFRIGFNGAEPVGSRLMKSQ